MKHVETVIRHKQKAHACCQWLNVSLFWMSQCESRTRHLHLQKSMKVVVKFAQGKARKLYTSLQNYV